MAAITEAIAPFTNQHHRMAPKRFTCIFELDGL